MTSSSSPEANYCIIHFTSFQADPISRQLAQAQCPALPVTGDATQAMATFNNLMDVTSKPSFFFYTDKGVDAIKSKYYVGSNTGNVSWSHCCQMQCYQMVSVNTYSNYIFL